MARQITKYIIDNETQGIDIFFQYGIYKKRIGRLCHRFGNPVLVTEYRSIPLERVEDVRWEAKKIIPEADIPQEVIDQMNSMIMVYKLTR